MKARYLVSTAVVGMVLCCIALPGRGDDAEAAKTQQQARPRLTADELEDKLKDLLDERVAAAKRSLDATQAAYDAQTVTIDQSTDAMLALKDSELAVVTTGDARLGILQRSLQEFRELDKKVERMYKLSVGGSLVEFTLARRMRIEAEIELLRERLKD